MVSHRLRHPVGVELGTLHLGCNEELLRALAKEQCSWVEYVAIVINELKCREQLLHRRVHRKRELPLLSRGAYEVANLRYAQVFDCNSGGLGGVERKDIYEPLVLKVLGERGIDRSAQIVVADKTLADDIVVDARNECRLSRVCLAGRLVDKADAILVSCRRAPIFPFSRRDALESTLPYVWPKMPR